MATIIQATKLAGLAGYFPRAASAGLLELEEAYEANRHRVYALSFWMTDNEITADELTRNVFLRAFMSSQAPTPEAIDRALIAELREQGPLGVLTLDCNQCTEVLNVRKNLLRVDLERAVVQLPRTERLAFLLHDVESYGHAHIARLLGLSEAESRCAVHQARLRIRQLVADMS
jgi:DNA-directed RNA polymerase specialized sigma24 family protein